MSVSFIEQKKKQKYLIFIFLGVIAVTLIVIWLGFFKEKTFDFFSSSTAVVPLREVKIDFEVLESPTLKDLKPFSKIPAFEGEAGRDNPFLPY